MSSINKVILIGRVGQDPDMRYMPNGDAVANFSLATSEQWKDKATGEKKETTEWHRLIAFRKLGEVVGEWVKKGALLYVEGKLQTRKWTDKDGNERITTEIVLDEMKMLGAKSEGGGHQAPRQDSKPRPAPNFSDDDDDPPF